MQGAIETAGTTCTLVSAFLSKAPSIPVVRRHARSEGGQFHFAPAVQVWHPSSPGRAPDL